jgi:hypothetical protein
MPRPLPPSAPTDRQRLLQASPSRVPLLSDRHRQTRAAAHPSFKPLVVNHSTFVIRGRDGTYLGLSFGDGRQAQQLNLYDYLPAHAVPYLSNFVFDLTGILPDAFGLDIGVAGGFEINNPLASKGSAGSFGLAGLGGINLIWHSRGDLRAGYPELHRYYGYSATASKGSIVSRLSSLVSPANLSGAVQLILAWARTYNKDGVGQPASNEWIANGYNWTGTFWSAGISIPVYGKFSLVGSVYQSAEFFSELRRTSIWRGLSIGVGASAKVSIKTGFKFDAAKLIRIRDLSNLKDLGINQSKTEYALMYGNGGDFIPAGGGQPKRAITGWHWPGINQNEDK